MDLDSLRYPIGRFAPRPALTPADREALIEDLAALPGDLERAVSGLGAGQLDTPYRPEGWTVRQVVHHLPDSHLNAYVRFKLALTEENPVIKPYDEAAWAQLPDGRGQDVGNSVLLLTALHRRWVELLRAMSDAQWQRGFQHPESGHNPLERSRQLYQWHGRHHRAQITSLAERSGW
jgi:hypothetical protein